MMQQVTQAKAELNRYVHSFVFRRVEVSASAGSVKKIIPPNHLTSLDFFFGHPFKTLDLNTGKEIPYKSIAIRGCRTFTKYAIEFCQPFSTFSIKFTPTGLYDLLGLDMTNFTDADICCKQLNLPFDEKRIYKQLEQSTNHEERRNIAENILLDALSQQSKKSRLAAFCTSTNEIEHQQIFLSERQRQRLFKKEVGLNPKSFSSLRRFSNLLKTKKQHQHHSWTSLAHELGYFDQAHFIKVFYSFLGIAPSLFNIDLYAL